MAEIIHVFMDKEFDWDNEKLLLGLGVIGTASARPTCASAVHWD